MTTVRLFDTFTLSDGSVDDAIMELKKHFIVSKAGDTLFVEGAGRDWTTYQIEFQKDRIQSVIKIQDSDRRRINDIVFERPPHNEPDEW